MSPGRPFAARLSPRARSDLLDIWLYIAERDAAAADRVIDEIERVCGLLIEHPKMGRERPEVAPGIRSFVAVSWVIFYRADDGGLNIVRVIHGARDIDSLDF
jgi:toxin ParE1/3/4